jgi:hypothetical protein
MPARMLSGVIIVLLHCLKSRSDDASLDLSALLTAGAKALGRNRIELSTLSPQSPSAQQASRQAAG